MKIPCITIALVLFLLFSFNAYSVELRIGDRAPNIVGNNALDKTRFNLFRVMTEMKFLRDSEDNLVLGSNGKYKTEFVHNIVVLNFFAKSCIPCLREIPTINRIAEKFKAKQVKFIYINVDPELSEEQFVRISEKYKIRIPLITLNQKEAIRKYDVQKLPRLVIIGFNKHVVKIVTGYQKNLEQELGTYLNSLIQKTL